MFFQIILYGFQTQEERDDLYRKFVKAIHEVQQKSSFKNLLLEKKLSALADTLEKKEAQLNEVLSASNLDPTALTVVTRKLEVGLWSFNSVPVMGFFGLFFVVFLRRCTYLFVALLFHLVYFLLLWLSLGLN